MHSPKVLQSFKSGVLSGLLWACILLWACVLYPDSLVYEAVLQELYSPQNLHLSLLFLRSFHLSAASPTLHTLPERQLCILCIEVLLTYTNAFAKMLFQPEGGETKPSFCTGPSGNHKSGQNLWPVLEKKIHCCPLAPASWHQKCWPLSHWGMGDGRQVNKNATMLSYQKVSSLCL